MSKNLSVRALLLFVAAVAACAQPLPTGLQHHYFSFGGGAGSPGADLQPYMDTKFAFRFLYGYRFLPNLQAEAGLDVVSGAANVDVRQQTFVGEIRKSDSELIVPFGLRAILPIARDRFELYAGGGGAYLHYGEDASVQDSDASVPCVGCLSRDGWGYYGIAGFQVALDRKHRFALGAGARFLRGRTSGDPLGTLPLLRTHDYWITSTVDFIVRL